ncbi:prepilin peptidase [Xenorhabdus sp. SGI246]
MALMCVFSYIISLIFPIIYLRIKKNTLQQYKELKEENDNVGIFPLISMLMFLLPVLIYFLSNDILLSVYCFLLAIVGYSDLSSRWIPDIFIYLLLGISVYSLHLEDVSSSLYASVLFVAPALFLSAYGYIIKREKWIASGDYYLFPSIGMMILPEYATGMMLLVLLFTLLLTRWLQKVPLITVVYFIFSGYQICNLSELL